MKDIEDTGNRKLANPHMCLTDPNGTSTNGTQVEVKNCRKATDQLWYI